MSTIFVADTLGSKKLSSSGQELSTIDSVQFTRYSYVEPAQQELDLEEIKALTASAEPLEQPLAKATAHMELANQMPLTSKHNHEIISASFLMQYLLLMQRILICARRNYVSKKPKTKHGIKSIN